MAHLLPDGHSGRMTSGGAGRDHVGQDHEMVSVRPPRIQLGALHGAPPSYVRCGVVAGSSTGDQLRLVIDRRPALDGGGRHGRARWGRDDTQTRPEDPNRPRSAGPRSAGPVKNCAGVREEFSHTVEDETLSAHAESPGEVDTDAHLTRWATPLTVPVEHSTEPGAAAIIDGPAESVRRARRRRDPRARDRCRCRRRRGQRRPVGLGQPVPGPGDDRRLAPAGHCGPGRSPR